MWTGARELSSNWLLTTFGSLFSSWFRLLFRFFRCHFLRSFFWLCSLLWGWSILGFDISIINLILRFVRVMFFINMMTPSTVCHVYVTFSTPNFQAIFRIEHLASDIRAFRFRVDTYGPLRMNNSDKSRQTFSHFCNLFSKCWLIFGISGPKFSNFDDCFSEFQEIVFVFCKETWKRSKSPRFSNFLGFHNEYF